MRIHENDYGKMKAMHDGSSTKGESAQVGCSRSWHRGSSFQLYFVRELIAAELLFVLGFAVFFALGAIFYVVGRARRARLGFGRSGNSRGC